MTSLVILPGLDGTATQHAEFAAAARACFDAVDVIAYPSARFLDYSALEEFVRARLPQGDFVLLGESFSGPVALRIARNPPPGLRALVLSTTFARSPLPFAGVLAPAMRLAPVRSVPMPVLSWLLLGRWTTEPLRRALAAALREVAAAVLRERARAALREDFAGLDAIAMPALYLRARGDRLVRARVGARLAASLPDCRLVDIDGPHLLLQAAPRDCAAAVAEFVAGLR